MNDPVVACMQIAVLLYLRTVRHTSSPLYKHVSRVPLYSCWVKGVELSREERAFSPHRQTTTEEAEAGVAVGGRIGRAVKKSPHACSEWESPV